MRGAHGRLDVALLAVVVAEYLAGVLLDEDPARRAAQRRFLEQSLVLAPVQNYIPAVAEHHTALLAHVRGTVSRAAHMI